MAALNERISDIESIIHVSNNMIEDEEGRPITDETDHTIEFDII